MTSINVATQATSPPRTATPVANRQMLWDKGVICIKIPSTARSGSVENSGTLLHYLQFPRNAKGGVVNFFVHGETFDDILGRKISAEVQIWRKEFVDGRSFLYIDLRPVPRTTRLTHRLVILDDVGADPENSIVFATPAPLKSKIVLLPPDSKVPTPMPAYLQKPAPVKPAAPSRPKSTGDFQLDRLLADGWTIARVGELTVSLTKGEGDKRRTMTHYRPKQQQTGAQKKRN